MDQHSQRVGESWNPAEKILVEIRILYQDLTNISQILVQQYANFYYQIWSREHTIQYRMLSGNRNSHY